MERAEFLANAHREVRAGIAAGMMAFAATAAWLTPMRVSETSSEGTSFARSAAFSANASPSASGPSWLRQLFMFAWRCLNVGL